MYGLEDKIIQLYCEKMIPYDKFSSIAKALKLINKNPVKTDFKLKLD